MLRAAVIAGLMCACALAVVLPAAGSDSGTLTVRIVATHDEGPAPCLTVSPNDVDLGGNDLSKPGPTTISGSPEVRVESCSPSPETVYAHGGAAVGGEGTWELVPGQTVDDNPCDVGTGVYHVWLHWQGADVGFGLADSAGPGVPFTPGGFDTLFFYVAPACEGSAGAGDTFRIPIIFTGVTS